MKFQHSPAGIDRPAYTRTVPPETLDPNACLGTSEQAGALLPARIRIRVYRTGLLSVLGHDLELELERFRVDVHGDAIEAVMDTRSLTVTGGLVHGRVDTTVPSKHDRTSIEAIVHRDILHTASYPQARFEGTLVGSRELATRVVGSLTLLGRARQLELTFARTGKHWCASTTLRMTSFGIEPYRTLGGVLKLKDAIEVAIELAATDTSDNLHFAGPT